METKIIFYESMHDWLVDNIEITSPNTYCCKKCKAVFDNELSVMQHATKEYGLYRKDLLNYLH